MSGFIGETRCGYLLEELRAHAVPVASQLRRYVIWHASLRIRPFSGGEFTPELLPTRLRDAETRPEDPRGTRPGLEANRPAARAPGAQRCRVAPPPRHRRGGPETSLYSARLLRSGRAVLFLGLCQ